MRKLAATAFTVVEMLVAVSIILLIVSLSFPAYQLIQEKIKISKVQNVEMRGLYQAVLLYKSENGLNTWPAPRKGYPFDHEYYAWYGPPTRINDSKDVCKILRPYYGEGIKEDGTVLDPWKNQYALKWDIDGSGKVEYYGKDFQENVSKDFIVVSLGKNQKQDDPNKTSFDDVYSFCSYKDKKLFAK